MSSKTTTVDLTFPLLVWFAIWGIPAAIFHSWTLFFVAVAPFVFVVGFVVAFFLLGVAAMFGAYMGGARVKFTNRKGEVRYYQRNKR